MIDTTIYIGAGRVSGPGFKRGDAAKFMRLFRCLLLTVIVGISGRTAGRTVAWQEGNPYSSSFLYNGFAYKVIRIFDTGDLSTSLLVGVATDASESCPGRNLRKCTVALMLVMNEGTKPFDVDPKVSSCECQGKKTRTLSMYDIPRYLRSAVPTGFLLLGNTVVAGDAVRGAVIYGGTCAEFIVRVPIVLAGQRVIFEFPFSRK